MNITNRVFYNKSVIKSENVGPIFLRTACIIGTLKPKLVILFNGKDDKIKLVEKNSGTELIRKKFLRDDFGNTNYYSFNKAKLKSKIEIEVIYEDCVLYTIELKNTVVARFMAGVFNNEVSGRMIRETVNFGRTWWPVVKCIKYIFHPKKFVANLKRQKKIIGNKKRSSGYIHPADNAGYRAYLANEKFEKKSEFEYNPLISLVIPVYNVPVEYLKECIDSILNQTYQNFEICIADDCSTKQDLIECLKEYQNSDERIKVVFRKENGHISAATNSAFEVATGEFVGLVDNDDILSKYALQEVVSALNENKSLDFIYSDEDKIDLDGRRFFPNFKPDFSPDLLVSCNYICHFTVIRSELVKQVGGWAVGLEGVQDHDLFLKVTEVTKNIHHIPKVLYHWRVIEGSTGADISNKDYIATKGEMMLKEMLKRRNLKGEVKMGETPIPSMYAIDYGNDNELVSIIIPTRDGVDIVKTCVDSIYAKSTYKNFEIILVDNGSSEESVKEFSKYEEAHDNFRVLRIDCEFNYSYLNNQAAKVANGEYILLLNNDVEVITENWLELMLGYARLEHVGCVGARLYYPTDLVQHNGVIMGLFGIAGHASLLDDRYSITYNAYSHLTTNYSAVTAACLMISKEKYLSVGGLNEQDLKVAFNDVDFCLRIREKGYYNLVNPKVELYHYESLTRGSDLEPEKIERFKKESKFIYDNYKEILKEDPFYNVNFSYGKAYHLQIEDRQVMWNAMMAALNIFE